MFLRNLQIIATLYTFPTHPHKLNDLRYIIQTATMQMLHSHYIQVTHTGRYICIYMLYIYIHKFIHTLRCSVLRFPSTHLNVCRWW